ncbi:AAA family ATPase [Gloeobacter violaceus]|uniref:AAA family ATPase n=1 Tax=Gloeobacter violaceus TaxID=33072 RepID=UPI0002ED32E6|nr:AAA family ATPase [Gloeobacter violaceus]
MDLFERHREQQQAAEAPLADRMRPRSLDQFVGQGHIVGPGRLLRRAIQADQLSSLIFYGPPGTGKTTLARIIAGTTRAHFIAINAVLAGVKDIREAIDEAKSRRGQFGRRTILFVDEVHRFNKSQQDALLPWIENGTIVLVGATTENPFFEVNKALVSRSRLFQLKLLESEDLRAVALQALADTERGYGKRNVRLDPEALAHLVDVAGGDARTLLNALELAVETTPADGDGAIRITLPVAEESIQRRAVLYDKEGDVHFDTISAYIKSLRGSDPDAALYWLARMIYAGEEPRFIFRRLLIQASEDVGLADPQALAVVVACAEAFDRVGMPEGRYHLAQATLYLATAPKSNSAMAFFDALAAVEGERASDIPNPLKDANRDKEGFGHGAGYLYPHAYRDHWVAQQYLPTSLQGQLFYQPGDQGYEAGIQAAVARRREAQLAALVETDSPERLSFGPADGPSERWLARAMGRQGEQLARLRDRIFELAAPERHHVILDAAAGSGLLTWEAIRRTPEGGVYARAANAADADALAEQAAALSPLRRPVILTAALEHLTAAVGQHSPGLRFERIVGRNLLKGTPHKIAVLTALQNLLAPRGVLVIAENMPSRGSRLWQLLDPAWLAADLYRRVVEAEELAFGDDPQLGWEPDDLQSVFEQAGLACEITSESVEGELRVSGPLLARWFARSHPRGAYAAQLARLLSPAEVESLEAIFRRQLLDRVVSWSSAVAYAVGRPV